MEHHRNGDFAAVMFRYTSVYGPRAPRQWMWSIVKRVLDGRKQIIIPRRWQPATSHLLCRETPPTWSSLAATNRKATVISSTPSTKWDTPSVTRFRIVAEALDHEFEIVEIGHPMAYDLAGGYSNRRTGQLSVYSMKKLLGYTGRCPAG